MTPTKSKISYPAGSTVIVLESHYTPEGESLRAGDRVRAEHVAVRRNPALFHEDGLTTAEILALHQARSRRPNLKGK